MQSRSAGIEKESWGRRLRYSKPTDKKRWRQCDEKWGSVRTVERSGSALMRPSSARAWRMATAAGVVFTQRQTALPLWTSQQTTQSSAEVGDGSVFSFWALKRFHKAKGHSVFSRCTEECAPMKFDMKGRNDQKTSLAQSQWLEVQSRKWTTIEQLREGCVLTTTDKYQPLDGYQVTKHSDQVNRLTARTKSVQEDN